MRLRRSILIGMVATVLLAISGIAASDATAAPVHRADFQLTDPADAGPNLTFYSSNRCIDVPHSSTDNVALIQYTCNGQSNQHWTIRPYNSLYARIVNEHSGKCMNVQGDSLANNVHIIQYPCSTSYTNELFGFHYVGSFPEKYYKIGTYRSINSDGPIKVLNVYKNGTQNGATIRQYTDCDKCYNEYIR